MKLRIRGDSIRLRLTQGDLATLVAQGTVSEDMRMSPETTFQYRLSADRDATVPGVSMSGRMLEVRLPRAQVEHWANSNDVGIEALQPNGNGEGLRVLVEKDFPCLTARPNEDDSDAFPWPEKK